MDFLVVFHNTYSQRFSNEASFFTAIIYVIRTALAKFFYTDEENKTTIFSVDDKLSVISVKQCTLVID